MRGHIADAALWAARSAHRNRWTRLSRFLSAVDLLVSGYPNRRGVASGSVVRPAARTPPSARRLSLDRLIALIWIAWIVAFIALLIVGAVRGVPQ